ncbi:MAG: DUF3108 domain-containing protein [Flavobacteriales bacterium]|nr:DUF3108 domain-containing protein [Flavobacteriales bacterium]
MTKSLFIAFLFLPILSSAQDCSEELLVPFYDGEELTYELSYNWGFLWAHAGRVNFTVTDTVYDSKPAWSFESYGTSLRHWDWFYKVRSRYASVATKTLESLEFSRIGQEGSNFYNREYSFSQNVAQMYYLDDDGARRSKKIQCPPCSHDVLTAIYYCRSIPFDLYVEDDLISLNLVLDGALHRSHLRYVGKESWQNPNTDIIYDCIKFKPKLIAGTVFSEGENMTVYVTDDDKRIPVYIETELVVGKAKVFLIENEE